MYPLCFHSTKVCARACAWWGGSWAKGGGGGDDGGGVSERRSFFFREGGGRGSIRGRDIAHHRSFVCHQSLSSPVAFDPIRGRVPGFVAVCAFAHDVVVLFV